MIEDRQFQRKHVVQQRFRERLGRRRGARGMVHGCSLYLRAIHNSPALAVARGAEKRTVPSTKPRRLSLFHTIVAAARRNVNPATLESGGEVDFAAVFDGRIDAIDMDIDLILATLNRHGQAAKPDVDDA
jgi:hypothetical protein